MTFGSSFSRPQGPAISPAVGSILSSSSWKPCSSDWSVRISACAVNCRSVAADLAEPWRERYQDDIRVFITPGMANRKRLRRLGIHDSGEAAMARKARFC